PGRVGEGDPLPLHDVDAERRRVEEDVGDVVVEEVHLIDVEDPAVHGGQDSGLDSLRPFPDGLLDVNCPDQTVLCYAERKVYHPNSPSGAFKGNTTGYLLRAMLAHLPFVLGIALERTALHHLYFRQESG